MHSRYVNNQAHLSHSTLDSLPSLHLIVCLISNFVTHYLFSIYTTVIINEGPYLKEAHILLVFKAKGVVRAVKGLEL